MRRKHAQGTGQHIYTFLTKILVLRPWDAKQWAIFMAQVFWNLGCHQGFRALDWLASVSGAKIIAEKKLVKILSPQMLTWGVFHARP